MRRPENVTAGDESSCRRYWGCYLQEDFRWVRPPTLRQPPTRADVGLAHDLTCMFLNPREPRGFTETEVSSARTQGSTGVLQVNGSVGSGVTRSGWPSDQPHVGRLREAEAMVDARLGYLDVNPVSLRGCHVA